MPRTRLSVCNRKVRFKTELEAVQFAAQASVPLRTYRCDRCRQFHLTSRTKGKRVPRPPGSNMPSVTLSRSNAIKL